MQTQHMIWPESIGSVQLLQMLLTLAHLNESPGDVLCYYRERVCMYYVHNTVPCSLHMSYQCYACSFFQGNYTQWCGVSFFFKSGVSRVLTLPQVLRSLPKQATDLSDLLEGRDHPFIVGAQLFNEAVDPLDLLGVAVLQENNHSEQCIKTSA